MLLTPLFGRQQEMGDVTEHAGLKGDTCKGLQEG